MTAMGLDLTSAFTSVAASHQCGDRSRCSRVRGHSVRTWRTRGSFSSFLMLLGRLEIYTVFIIFHQFMGIDFFEGDPQLI